MDQPYTKHLTESIPLSDIPKTPTRKRSTTQTPRKARLQQEDIPWTAARCNRLLRTIASRIHILRRLSENDFAEQSLRTPKTKRKRDISVDPVVEKLGSKLAALETPSRGDDPEWFPTTEKKGVARTYGGKGRPRKTEAAANDTQGGEGVGFRTPFIRRILRPDAAVSPADDAYSTSSRLAQMSRKGRQDSIQPKTHAERALKTLLDSFDGLLASTNSRTTGSRRGASSMLGMCLRKIPAYIDYEQNYAEEVEYDYAFDGIETVYLDLERLGGSSWHGLRQVTRAHAVSMIVDAMAERMWPLKSLDALMDICAKHDAVLEGQRLLRSWLVSSKGKIEKPVEKFVELCVKSESVGFMFRTLGDLLGVGTLKCSELSNIAELWQELPVAMARRSHQTSAAAFLERYAIACAGLVGESIDDSTTASNNVGVLCATIPLVTSMCLMANHRNALSEDGASGMVDQVQRVVLKVAANLRSPARLNDTRHPDHSRNFDSRLLVEDLFLTSGLVVSETKPKFDSSSDTIGLEILARLLFERDLRAKQRDSVRQASIDKDRAARVCKALKCIESSDRFAAQDITKRTCVGLHQAGEKQHDEATSTMASLAIEVAAIWAEYRGDNASHAFADDIRRRALGCSRSTTDVRASQSPNAVIGFRWEEDIGEYVATTPFEQASSESKSTDGSILSLDSGIGLSESDTPSRKPTVTAVQHIHEKSPTICTRPDEVSSLDHNSPDVVDDVHDLRANKQAFVPTSTDEELSATKYGQNLAHTGVGDFPPTADQQKEDELEFDPTTPCLLQWRAHNRRLLSRDVCDDRDELSMSPCKSKVLDIEPKLREGAGVSHSHEAADKSEPETFIPTKSVAADERDELAMTPRFARPPGTPAPKKKTGTKAPRRTRARAVEATPARMTLRSQRKARPVGEGSHGLGSVSDDELGV